MIKMNFLFSANILLMFSTFLLVLGCGTPKTEPTFLNNKQKLQGNENKPTKVPTFEETFTQVIAPKCAKCHSSDGTPPALDSWNSISQRISDIKRTAIDLKTMPKGNPLTNEQLNLLNSWIQGGAPGPGQTSEEPTDPTPINPDPTPNPQPQPQITYELVKEKVFEARCYKCHDPADEALFQNYENVVSNIQLIKNRVFEDEKKPMPPKREGPLTAEQANILKEWIKAGTPEK